MTKARKHFRSTGAAGRDDRNPGGTRDSLWGRLGSARRRRWGMAGSRARVRGAVCRTRRTRNRDRGPV